MADDRRTEAMSRFRPSDPAAAREGIVTANARAERLACRIVAARHALRRGESSESVLAILGSAAAADPLRALLADEGRAVEHLAGVFYDATPGRFWSCLPIEDRRYWLLVNGPGIRAVLAALREVAGG